MRRKILIKATAWINVGILVLAICSAKCNPESIFFDIFAAVYSVGWLIAFFFANIDDPAFLAPNERSEGWTTRIREKVTGMLESIKKN